MGRGVLPEPIGEAIKRLRGKRKQAILAEAAGMPASSWSEYERGTRTPRPRQLERIVQALGCDLATFEAEVRQAAGHGPPVEELLKDTDRELREVEHEIDRCQSRRRLLVALRNYLSELPEGSFVPGRKSAWRF
jgi:transcriptional regulator with XRE-family HTH domain